MLTVCKYRIFVEMCQAVTAKTMLLNFNKVTLLKDSPDVSLFPVLWYLTMLHALVEHYRKQEYYFI